jgi:phage terminase large subunit GpA-like protein
MDDYNDYRVKRIVLMFSAQMAKTELLLNMIGFAIHHHWGPLMMIQPTGDMAQAFVKDRLSPTIRDTEPLRIRVRDTKKKTEETLQHKKFPGGHLTIIGSNSSSQLASRPIRDVFADEIDRWPRSVGKNGQVEGDPFSLVEKRQTTFWSRKTVVTSTPTVKGLSRIESLFEDGNMNRMHVPCPHCGALQTLKWANVKWPEDRPELAHYECEHCAGVILDSHRQEMLQAGQWVPEHPERGVRISTYAINELYSPWRGFPAIAMDFLEAKRGGPDTLRVFVNTVLGETWDHHVGEVIDPDAIEHRAEAYAAVVPRGVAYLTAGVDVQHDRLELLIVGHGANDERWVIAPPNSEGAPHAPIVVWGSPAVDSTWKLLDKWLFSSYPHECGKQLKISLALVDSSDGATQEHVLRYTKARGAQRVFACKGLSREAPLASRPTESNSAGAKVFPVGTWLAKDRLFECLRKVVEPGPGYIHFPLGLPPEFFKQLTSEKAVVKMRQGVKIRVWTKTRDRNEVLDLMVYNLAASSVLDIKDVPAMISAIDRDAPIVRRRRKVLSKGVE